MIYDAYGERLHAWLTAVAGDVQLAEDALQELFILIARHPHRLADADRIDRYLFAMARNALNGLSRQRRRHAAEPLPDYLQAVDAEDGVEVREAELRGLEQALRSLPQEQREVVALKAFEGMTFAAIADLLNIPPNTAASRWRYAIEKLRTLLATEGHHA